MKQKHIYLKQKGSTWKPQNREYMYLVMTLGTVVKITACSYMP